jgi:hypothetical protein
MKIEILNGQKIEIIPIATASTKVGTKLLLGKVVRTSRYVLWQSKLDSHTGRSYWLYMSTGTQEDLQKKVIRICGNITIETQPGSESLPKE